MCEYSVLREGKVRTKGRFDQYCVVELFHVCSHAKRGHGVKHTQWVTPFNEFVSVSLMKSARYEKNNVVDHV